MKIISTKNLYLCTLKQVQYKDYHRTYDETFTKKEKKYILAKKEQDGSKYKDVYIDIFTQTPYKYITDFDLVVGDWGVTSMIPCITNARFITEEQALEILESENTNFITFNKKETKAKKRVRSPRNKD